MNLAAQRPRGSPSFAIQSDLVAHENVVVVHTGCDGTDDDARFVVGSMDHLTITDIDAGMVGVNHNIAGLRIGHTGPTHEVDRGAQTAVASREAIAYKTGAVKAVRPNATPRVSVSELAIGTRNNGTAVNGMHISEPTALKNGDRVMVGDVTLRGRDA